MHCLFDSIGNKAYSYTTLALKKLVFSLLAPSSQRIKQYQVLTNCKKKHLKVEKNRLFILPVTLMSTCLHPYQKFLRRNNLGWFIVVHLLNFDWLCIFVHWFARLPLFSNCSSFFFLSPTVCVHRNVFVCKQHWLHIRRYNVRHVERLLKLYEYEPKRTKVKLIFVYI